MHTLSSLILKGSAWSLYAIGLPLSVGLGASQSPVNIDSVKRGNIVVESVSDWTLGIAKRLVPQKYSELLEPSFWMWCHANCGGMVVSQIVEHAEVDVYILNFIAVGNFTMPPSLFKSLPFGPQRLSKSGV